MPAGYGFAEETSLKRIQNILNDKTIEDPYERFRTAVKTIDSVQFDLSFEESIQLFKDILLPYAEKNVKDELQRDKAKGYIYVNFFEIYGSRKLPREDKEFEEFLEKIVKNADLLKDERSRASVYKEYGTFQSMKGNLLLAHDYFYKAIAVHESINNYRSMFSCLYRIAADHSHTKTLAGIRKVMEQMQHYIEQPSFDGCVSCLYNYYTVQTTY
jgi:hypothetical protein